MISDGAPSLMVPPTAVFWVLKTPPQLDPFLLQTLRTYKLLKGHLGEGHQKCSSFSCSQFRYVFIGVLRYLGLDTWRFRSRSLRPGGATQLLGETRNPELVMAIGRWPSMNPTRTYLETGGSSVGPIHCQYVGPPRRAGRILETPGRPTVSLGGTESRHRSNSCNAVPCGAG